MTNLKNEIRRDDKISNQSSESEDSKKHIHVILHSTRFKKFLTLKQEFEQNSDVDVIRLCIDKVYESRNEEKVHLRPVLDQQVSLLLKNKFLSRKHLVLTKSDVINNAVHYWLQTIRSELNLHNFSFRKELSEDEQRLCAVIIENQYKYERGLSFDLIKDLVKDIEEGKIVAILNKFIENDLIQKNTLENKDYYFVPVP